MESFDVDAVWEAVDAIAPEAVAISKDIWRHPETGYQEKRASEKLEAFLEGNGFEVECGVAGLPTAFRASWGSEGPVLAFIGEYDALPGLGHACGHNLIGPSAALAGISLARHLDGSGIAAQVRVYGTPAEEGAAVENGSGKVPMVEQGLFDDVDLALMIHGASSTVVERASFAGYTLLVDFTGKAAHAGGAPWEGVNAQTAANLVVGNLNAMRQQLPPQTRLNPVITCGTDVANTIPAHGALKINLRSDSSKGLDAVLGVVERSIEAASLVTGAKSEVRPGQHRLEPYVPNHTVGLVWKRYLDRLGIESTQRAETTGGCTDFGNVSRVCPSLSGYLKIGDGDLVGHTPGFCQAANGEQAYKALVDGAKAMAATAAAYLYDEGFRKAAWDEHRARFGR